MPKIEVFTTRICPYCKRAKALLDKKGAVYEEIDVSDDAALRESMTERAGGVRTVALGAGEAVSPAAAAAVSADGSSLRCRGAAVIPDTVLRRTSATIVVNPRCPAIPAAVGNLRVCEIHRILHG